MKTKTDTYYPSKKFVQLVKMPIAGLVDNYVFSIMPFYENLDNKELCEMMGHKIIELPEKEISDLLDHYKKNIQFQFKIAELINKAEVKDEN